SALHPLEVHLLVSAREEVAIESSPWGAAVDAGPRGQADRRMLALQVCIAGRLDALIGMSVIDQAHGERRIPGRIAVTLTVAAQRIRVLRDHLLALRK